MLEIWNELWKEGANTPQIKAQLIGIAIQCGGHLLTILSVGFAVNQLRRNHDWNRRKAAQDAINAYENLGEVRALLDKHFDYLKSDSVIDTSKIEKACKGDPQVRASIHQLLNYVESLAIGVHNRVLDERIVKNAMGTVIRVTRSQFAGFIEQSKSGPTDDFMSETDALLAHWKKKPSLWRRFTA